MGKNIMSDQTNEQNTQAGLEPAHEPNSTAEVVHCSGEEDGVIQGTMVIEEDVVKLVIIEEHIKLRKEIPYAAAYRIRVDKQTIDVPHAEISGEEILKRAGKDPQKTKLYQHKPGQQPQRVMPNQIVDLRCHGIERFTTMANDSTEGHDATEAGDPLRDRQPFGGEPLRREFLLPGDDEQYLNSRGWQWETVKEKNPNNQKSLQWLIIRDWKLPSGYNHEKVDIALLIPPSYSDTQIDMVYVRPALAKTDGRHIGALINHKIDNVEWQRWSRHRTAENPWRTGVDDISTHLSLVDDWFHREFKGE